MHLYFVSIVACDAIGISKYIIESFRSNTFTIEDNNDFVKLTKIEVMRDDKGDNWYLDNVSSKYPEKLHYI